MKPETEYANYEDFDLDGPAHKESDERIKDAIANGLLVAIGLPVLGSSQTEQEKPHEQT